MMDVSEERRAPLRQFQNDQFELFCSLAAIGIPWELCAGVLVECRDRISIAALKEKIELSVDRTVPQYGEPGWLRHFLEKKQLSFRLFPILVLLLCDLASGLERNARIDEASSLLREAKDELCSFARQSYASVGDVDKLVEMEMLMLEGALLSLYLKGGLVAEASVFFNGEGEKPYLSAAVDKVAGLYGRNAGAGKRSAVHEISGFFSKAAELEKDGRFSLADKYYDQAITLSESAVGEANPSVLPYLASLDYQVQCLLSRRRFDLAQRLVELQGEALSTYASTWHRDFARYRQLVNLVAIYAGLERLDQSLSLSREAISLSQNYCLDDSGLAWSKSLLVRSLIDYYVLLLTAQMPEAEEVFVRFSAFENWQSIFISQCDHLSEQGRSAAGETAMKTIEGELPAFLDSLSIEENFALTLKCASLLGSGAAPFYERAVDLAVNNQALRDTPVKYGGKSDPLKEAVEQYVKYLEQSTGKGRLKRKKELLALLKHDALLRKEPLQKD